MNVSPFLPQQYDVARLAEILRDYGNAINKRSSGTYTPVLANVVNLDASTAYACQYLRVENTVHVSGKIDVDPTSASTLTQLTLTLPIISNFTAQEQCAGVGAVGGVAGMSAAVTASVGATTALLSFTTGTDVANRAMLFTLTYQLL